MASDDLNEWVTISSGSLETTLSDARSGFSTSLESITASSLLEAYSNFFVDMQMILNLPSSANATEISNSSLGCRLITDFNLAFPSYENYQRFSSVYNELRREKVKFWPGFCNEPIAPFLFTCPDKKDRFSK